MFMEKSIEEIARESIPAIAVLGIGGAGCNIVSWMKEKEVTGASIYGLNSDAQHLSITKADKRLLLGYNSTAGLGCGGFPERGAKSAEESEEQIKQLIQGAGLVCLTAGFGGGTGTGATPAIAKIAKDLGAVTLSVVTIPFQVERARLAKAKEGLKRLVEACDAVIVIDNNRLRKVAGSLPLEGAFGVANELIASFIKNVSETIAVPSLMNLDFADFKSIMMGSGVCAIGFGEGQGDTKVEDAVERALTNQLLDIGDIRKSEGALVHIEGGADMTLEDINRAGELVIDRISPNAKVSWGARISNRMEGSLRAAVVLAGVDSPFLIEQLQAFGVVKAEIAMPLEVELAKKVQQSSSRKGLFSRIFQ
jgi:cell division protein FtsZ